MCGIFNLHSEEGCSLGPACGYSLPLKWLNLHVRQFISIKPRNLFLFCSMKKIFLAEKSRLPGSGATVTIGEEIHIVEVVVS